MRNLDNKSDSNNPINPTSGNARLDKNAIAPNGAAAPNASQAAVAAQYIKAAAGTANDILGAQLQTPLVPLQLPAQGDFTWSYTNGNNFNATTYNYVTGAVTPSSADPSILQLGANSTFTNAYQTLLNGISFQYSTADQQRLQDSQTKSDTQATSVVSAYNAQYGAPTAAQYEAASTALGYTIGANNEIDYITQYMCGYIWAGKPSSPLSLQAMQNSPSLSDLLANAPASAQSTIMQVQAYLNALGPGAQLRDAQSLGNWTLKQLKNNMTPSAANGGMQLFNPTSSGFALGYSLSPSTGSILQQLSNTGQSATFSFTAQQTSSQQYDISFSGSAGISFGGWLLGGSAGTSWQGDLAGVSGAGSSMTITVTYPGLTKISVAPMGWNGAALQSPGGVTTGWWYEAILFQALQNLQLGANAQTGFTFGSAIPGNIQLGTNGTGFLSTIVVSSYPTISVQFNNGSYSAFSQWLRTHTSVSVSLFGCIPLGGASVDTYTASAQQGSSDSSFTLTLTPPPPAGITIPVQQQTVPVLGVTATWAGASQS